MNNLASHNSITPHCSGRSFLPHAVAWQKGFHDRIIHSDDQRDNTLNYIHYNAWRHDIVEDINDWPWTSLHCPHLVDGLEVV